MANSPAAASLAGAIPASALTPAGGATMPAAPAYGKTVLTPQQQAALDVQKTVALIPVEADKANQVANAANLADAQKTYNVAASALPRAMQRFEQLRQAAPLASSGGGVSDQEPEQGVVAGILPAYFSNPDYKRYYAKTAIGGAIDNYISKGDVATANQTMEQAANQGILSELGPQLQGLKGNKFLESIASGASGLDMADPPNAKIHAINGLQDQYISNLMSLVNQRQQLGDPNTPSQSAIADMIMKNVNPTYPVSVISPDGTVGRVAAKHLGDLVNAGGKIQ
jgi:hypothetical protein